MPHTEKLRAAASRSYPSRSGKNGWIDILKFIEIDPRHRIPKSPYLYRIPV